jgi:hypothetical protein
MFAIGYGIPPNGPLRAIRLNSTPLASEIAEYLKGRTPADLVVTKSGGRQ